jgi:hypothetical protein
MTDKTTSPRIAALQALEASYQRHRQDRMADHGAGHEHGRHGHGSHGASDHADHRKQHHDKHGHKETSQGHTAHGHAAHAHATHTPASPRRRRWWVTLRSVLRRPIIRKLLLGTVATLAGTAVAMVGLWWRLATGPIELDLATPWLAAAIEKNFGGRHTVEVGGTQIERDANGRTSLRLRDIVVRDADRHIVAAAPKAEVSLSTASLLTGHLRATRLSLVSAELAVRIERDGQITISAGADKPPLAITPAIVKSAAEKVAAAARAKNSSGAAPASNEAAPAPAADAAVPTSTQAEHFAAFLAWVDNISTAADDGELLGEVGLIDGNLSVDDQRTGRKWAFENIDLSLTRPRHGDVRLSVGSDNPERPWLLTASIAPSGFNKRAIQIEARKVSVKELLLAMRLDEGRYQVDIPLSAAIRAEVGMDGIPQSIAGRIIADAGAVGEIDRPDSLFTIDHAEANLDWDAGRRTMVFPFQILSGGNRITLLGQADAPRETGAPWRITVTGGSVVLTAGGPADEAPLILNRILVRTQFAPALRRFEVEQGEVGTTDVGVAFSGSLDFASGEPRLTAGLAGTQMTVSALKRIWPVFITPKVRTWVLDHVGTGAVERLVIAANAPIETMKEDGPPLPDDGLSIELVTTNTIVRPIDTLPPIRDADLTTRVAGRDVTITLGRGTIEMPSGRKLAMTNGVFEVPDTFPKSPPARARFRIEGPVPAAAELLAMDRLRDASGTPIEPAASRGTLSGQVTVALPMQREYPPGTAKYSMNIDVANFAAERMVLGQKVEATSLHVNAATDGYQIKGDVKINGTPAVLDFRKDRADPGADVRIQATLDEGARARFGFDLGSALSGPVPIKLAGKITPNQESRFAVEADLTPAKIENLLPGWIKPPGRSARATFTMVGRQQSTRFEDLSIEGAGVAVKGNVEIDSSGDLQTASFPVFALSDGDKATIKVDRANDGALRVSMRGEVYDGRGFVKATMGTTPPEQRPRPLSDLDLDVRLGAVAGFNGEALRGVELKLARRAGQIKNFVLNAKIGRDTPFTGDFRRLANGRQVMYFETADAGALFRFTDTYARVVGGQLSAAMDPPNGENAPQEGVLNIRDFSIRGEPALDKVVAGASNGGKTGVDFTRMRVDFTRVPGKLAIRDGVVRGPVIGATIDGNIDFVKNDVRMRGTFVPLYGLNNAFGQIPIVGLFLGGSNEGLVGITYEVVGPPNAPILRVNPISAIAPGLLRKFFEFPATEQTAPAPSTRSDAR